MSACNQAFIIICDATTDYLSTLAESANSIDEVKTQGDFVLQLLFNSLPLLIMGNTNYLQSKGVAFVNMTTEEIGEVNNANQLIEYLQLAT